MSRSTYDLRGGYQTDVVPEQQEENILLEGSNLYYKGKLQSRPGWTNHSIDSTLNGASAIRGFERAYINGALVLSGTTFTLEDGTGPLKLLIHSEKSSNDSPGVVLIDNRWEKSATPILQVAADPEYSDILQCAGGQFVGGAATPISQRRMGKGQRRPSRDVEWYFKRSGGSEQLLFDPNHYRSKFHEGLATEPGNPGSITYFGTHASRIMAEHLGAKYVMRRDANRRDFEEWKNNRDVIRTIGSTAP